MVLIRRKITTTTGWNTTFRSVRPSYLLHRLAYVFVVTCYRPINFIEFTQLTFRFCHHAAFSSIDLHRGRSELFWWQRGTEL